MNRFIKTINIIIFFLVGLFFILTLIDVNEKTYKTDFNKQNILEHANEISKEIHSIINEEAHEEVFKYITNNLKTYGLIEENTTSKPAFMIQESWLTLTNYTTNDLFDIANNPEFYTKENYVFTEPILLKNIIAHIPANGNEKTKDAIMIMAHYDSVPMGNGASDDAVAVGVMLEAIRFYLDKMANGFILNNDLVFVFTDGEEFGLHGAQAFIGSLQNDVSDKEPFRGFNDITSRIKFAVNLESRGTSGTLIMFETSKNNFNSVKLFSKINKNVFTSSIANMVYQSMPNGTDFSKYNKIYQGLNFANLGEGYNYHTQNDSYENIKMSYLSQQAVFINDLIEETADFDFDSLYETNQNAIYFSYLNFSTIYYSNKLAKILAVIALIMVMAILLINIFTNNNLIKRMFKTLKGYGVIIISLFATVIVTFTLYKFYVFTATLFGTIDRHAANVFISNSWIVIGLVLISFMTTSIVSYFTVKLFKVNGSDVRRSATYFITFLALITTTILPVTSYLFIFTALMMLTVLLIESVLKKFDINSLSINLLIFALTIPLALPVVFLASDALGINMAYAFAAVVAIFSFIIIPYHNEGIKLIVCKKLCQLNKNCKLEKSLRGMLLVFVFAFLYVLVLSGIKTNISSNNLGKQSYSMLPYDDALVYVKKENENFLMIKDLDAYIYLKKNQEGYHYDNNLEAYVKRESVPNINLSDLSDYQWVNSNLTIDRKNNNGYLEIKLMNNQNITQVEVNFSGRLSTYNLNPNTDYSFRIRNDADFKFVHNGSSIVADIYFSELLIDCQMLSSFDDFKLINATNQAKSNLIYTTKIK